MTNVLIEDVDCLMDQLLTLLTQSVGAELGASSRPRQGVGAGQSAGRVCKVFWSHPLSHHPKFPS